MIAETTHKLISAAAISRILKNAGIKKAHSTGWSIGFSVIGYGPVVEVGFQTTDDAYMRQQLADIVKVVNGHKSGRYFAVTTKDHLGSEHVRVVARDENEAEEAETVKEVSEESGHAVTTDEVNAVLTRRFFPYMDLPQSKTSGYVLSRAEGSDSHLVRVVFKDHPHTTYSPETGGPEVYAQTVTERYSEALTRAGYSAVIGLHEGEWSLLVGRSGEFLVQSVEEEAEAAEGPLLALRKAVEDKALSYMTRQAGHHSLFVYYLVPFKDKVRRVEVFWSGGVYKSRGQFGQGIWFRHATVEAMVEFIHGELAE